MEAILAEFAGALAGKALLLDTKSSDRGRRIRGSVALLTGLFLLSQGWDRAGCFPAAGGYSDSCSKLFPMLAPLAAGFMASLERSWANRSSVRHIGKRRVRLISLSIAAAILFPFAVFSIFLSGWDSNPGPLDSSILWPLFSSVGFGVVFSFYGETYCEEKLLMPTLSPKMFFVTDCCTCLLALVFGLELSLLGFLFCSLILWMAVRDLGDPSGWMAYSILESDPSDSIYSLFKNPLKHILSERKSQKIALFLLINTLFMVVEFIYGFMNNSLGLISDACHMLFDCAALAIGLYASYISRLPANSKFNYGYGRFEVLSGYVNAVFLVLIGSLIVLESIERILEPQEISTDSLLFVSVGGLVVNLVGLAFFHEAHHHAHGGGCSHSHSNESHGHSHTCAINAAPCSGMEHNNLKGGDISNGVNDFHDNHDHSSGVHGDAHIRCSDHNHHEDKFCDQMSHDNSCNSHSHNPKGGQLNHEQHQLIVSSHEHDKHNHSCADDHLMWGEDGHKHYVDDSEKKDSALQSEETRSVCSSHHVGNTSEHHQHCENNHLHTHSHSGQEHSHLEHSHSQSGHEHSHLEHSHSHSGHGHSHLEHRHSHSGHGHSHLEKSLSNLGHEHSHSGHGHSLLEKNLSTLEHSNTTELGKSKNHRHIDHNMEGIFLHVLADTLGSVGVVISTLLLKYRGWMAADPACSIFISFMIISSAIPLLRNAAEILLQRVPRFNEHDIKQAFKDVQNLKGVHDLQNIHVWSFTNKEIIGTLHLHISAKSDKTSIGEQVAHLLHEAGVKDLTLQMESLGDS
jgi:zinc transporter 5/7